MTPRLLTIMALVAATPLLKAAVPQTGSGENGGYTLVWQDLFDDDELRYDRWNIEVNGSGGGNNELQYYSDRTENVRVGKDSDGNGCLILTARRESYKGKEFTSGRINSKNMFVFCHGKVEASIRFPETVAGLWPAFWMMGNDYDAVGWPKSGEIDIVEMGHQTGIANGTSDRFFNGAAHWGQGWPNASYAKEHTQEYSLQDGDFHLFTLIWDENALRMYVDLDRNPDALPYYEMTIPADNPSDEWSPGNYFHKENFIIFNLAVGGNFPGIYNAAGITALNDSNGHEASMYVNYVKVYQKGTPDESIYMASPGDAPTSSMLPAAVQDNAPVTVFDLSGRIVATGDDSTALLPAGIYIVRQGDSTRKIIKR